MFHCARKNWMKGLQYSIWEDHEDTQTYKEYLLRAGTSVSDDDVFNDRIDLKNVYECVTDPAASGGLVKYYCKSLLYKHWEMLGTSDTLEEALGKISIEIL